MTSKDYFSVKEAVDTLTQIVNLEAEEEAGIISSKSIPLHGVEVKVRSLEWFHPDGSSSVLRDLRQVLLDIMRTVHTFYQDQLRSRSQAEDLEDFRSIMLLIGEAVEKLDGHLKNMKLKDEIKLQKTLEFRDLERFFHEKLAAQLEGNGGSSIISMSRSSGLESEILDEEPLLSIPIIKRDASYELLYLKRENGTPFLDEALSKNVRLVCHLSQEDLATFTGEDPLVNLKNMEDKSVQILAQSITHTHRMQLDEFFRKCEDFKDFPLTKICQKVLMAILLAANPRNLLRSGSLKGCHAYFNDFLQFLREALFSPEYQRLASGSNEKVRVFQSLLTDLCHSLCYSVFIQVPGRQELMDCTQELIKQGKIPRKGRSKSISSICEALQESYDNLERALRHHPNGPLFKTLDLIQDRHIDSFDNVMQGNLPHRLFDLYVGDEMCTHVKMPSPTFQEFIHKAWVTEEFKGFLRSYAARSGREDLRHLMINLQDRTSAEEYARCHALETLPNRAEFSPNLWVATLSKDSDFYHQQAPYHDLNDVQHFKKHFLEHLSSKDSGFSFPRPLYDQLFPRWASQAMTAVQKGFFENRHELNRKDRLKFIEIFYLLLQLKLIELSEPETFSLTCKDCVDTGVSASAAIYIFLQVINYHEWSKEDLQHLHLMVFGPALSLRERLINGDCFLRTMEALHQVEHVFHGMPHKNSEKIKEEVLSPLFNSSILDCHISFNREH